VVKKLHNFIGRTCAMANDQKKKSDPGLAEALFLLIDRIYMLIYNEGVRMLSFHGRFHRSFHRYTLYLSITVPKRSAFKNYSLTKKAHYRARNQRC